MLFEPTHIGAGVANLMTINQNLVKPIPVSRKLLEVPENDSIHAQEMFWGDLEKKREDELDKEFEESYEELMQDQDDPIDIIDDEIMIGGREFDDDGSPNWGREQGPGDQHYGFDSDLADGEFTTQIGYGL